MYFYYFWSKFDGLYNVYFCATIIAWRQKNLSLGLFDVLHFMSYLHVLVGFTCICLMLSVRFHRVYIDFFHSMTCYDIFLVFTSCFNVFRKNESIWSLKSENKMFLLHYENITRVWSCKGVSSTRLLFLWFFICFLVGLNC